MQCHSTTSRMQRCLIDWGAPAIYILQCQPDTEATTHGAEPGHPLCPGTDRRTFWGGPDSKTRCLAWTICCQLPARNDSDTLGDYDGDKPRPDFTISAQASFTPAHTPTLTARMYHLPRPTGWDGHSPTHLSPDTRPSRSAQTKSQVPAQRRTD